jgi:hypothetical protein
MSIQEKKKKDIRVTLNGPVSILIQKNSAVYYNQSEGAGVFFFTSITRRLKNSEGAGPVE